MSIQLLTEHHLEFLSLKGGCTGSYVSTLVKKPHCSKSHVTAHLLFFLHTIPNDDHDAKLLTVGWFYIVVYFKLYIENKKPTYLLQGVQTQRYVLV